MLQLSKGTNKEIFGEDRKVRISDGQIGRSRVNRDLVKRLLQEDRYSYQQIADYCDCTARTIRNIRDELIEAGEITDKQAEKGPGIIEAEFDDETERVYGVRFSDWIKSKRKAWKTCFNFCRRVWENVWDKPSLVLIADPNSNLGDQVCMQFLNEFGDDDKRIRDRKKLIRRLFSFLRREDLNDSYLTMSKTQDPIPIRRIPEIGFKDFPINLEKSLKRYGELMGDPREADKLRAKIAMGARTGSTIEERGWSGIKVGSQGKSYAIFKDPDDWQINLFEKQSEEWVIHWLPKRIAASLYEIYKEKKMGDLLIAESDHDVQNKRDTWYKASEEIIGFKCYFHDFRKVFVTWIVIMGVPLEIAAGFNVGWKDLNTLRDHYLHIRRLLKKSDRAEYRANIPDWFKEGLEEYTEGI